MKYQAGILLLKNKLRLMKGTVRHTWPGLIGLIGIGGILLYQFFFAIVKTGYGAVVAPRGRFYVLLLVAAVSFFRVFLSQTPVFRIEAASVLLTYNTGYFNKMLRRRQIWSMIRSVFAAGIIACLLSGFLFNAVFLETCLLLLLYLCSCTFLSWIFYHGRGKRKWAVCLVFALCTAALFWQSPLSAAALAVSWCGILFYAWRILRLNLPKYYERLQILEAASAAISQNNFTKMQQMAEENRPSYVRGPRLHQLKPAKRSALWYKSLLEIFRMQKQTNVFLVLLLLAGWIVSRTKLLAFMPLLDQPAIKSALTVFCTATALSGLHQLLIKQAKTVSEKRKLGLSLPYTTKQIIAAYGLSAAILDLLLAAAISFLYAAFSLRFFPFLFAEMLSYFIPCCVRLYETRFRRGAVMAANMLLFAGVYYLLMM